MGCLSRRRHRDGPARQFPGLAPHLDSQVAVVLIADSHELSGGRF
jgi:hypothetical protein